MRSVRLSWKVASNVLAYLRWDLDLQKPVLTWQEWLDAVHALEAGIKPKRSVKLARAIREATKERAHHATAVIREQVMLRANELCEACDTYSPNGLQMDHFFGGSGRRRAEQSAETCWALCPYCHRQKTDNRPSAGWWLKEFINHVLDCAGKAADRGDRDAERRFLDACRAAEARLDSLNIQGRT